MNTPPTLDRFEAALLDELRAQVATRPVVVPPAPEAPRRGHRRRWVAGLAAAAAAATAYVVVSPGGPAVSPAYAVSENADGDVVVTVHRLEDADGLERALREHGIDAEVSFDPSSRDGRFTFRAPEGATGDVPPEGGTVEREESGGSGPKLDQDGPSTQAEPADPGEAPDPAGCGSVGEQPATLAHEGDDWVLRIPAESPLQDRPVQITTGPDGDLGVFYEGDAPGSSCGVMSVG